MSLRSDNAGPVAPAIMAAMAAANQEAAAPYGDDPYTKSACARVRDLFETPEAAVVPVATGTAANALGLAAMAPPWGVILAHADAHIDTDECGAVPFYTHGARIHRIPGDEGKLTPEAVRAVLAELSPPEVHHMPPAALSLTNLTEAGTRYTPEEVRALAAVAREHGLPVHMDGARFANAVAACGCTPAELSWRAGVDMLTFGATKNGAMAAEALVVFEPALAATLGYRRKRGGHLWSKGWYLGAQLDAYLDDELWLANARNANAMAARLADGLGRLAGVRLVHPVEGNIVFAAISERAADCLAEQGWVFNESRHDEAAVIRLVAGFTTTPAEVDAAITAVSEAVAGTTKG
ncbi:L-threonine aldolase [Limimonas halophila]|uniref:L-threonine aldolase n=1 Tax=Limimonas halophila TaxID=1082479 RepID=A0A1G7L8H0_9PROT|nr:beta-eliminating lyase-related protein [Limimonas halophila]SDF45753.1 L-threonine aldolase [Limimonas halophila]